MKVCTSHASCAVAAALVALATLPHDGSFAALLERGEVRSRPNVFGGMDYELPNGEQARTRPNVFGGRDVFLPDGRRVVCRPNVFGGEDCR